MAEEWLRGFKELTVPHTERPNLISTLGDKVKIRSWQVRDRHISTSVHRHNTVCYVNMLVINILSVFIYLHV